VEIVDHSGAVEVEAVFRFGVNVKSGAIRGATL
jgi:hypothetical protein